jgi:hypothetical protein
VVIELVDAVPWTIRGCLSLEDASSLSRRCCQAINENLTPEG